MAEKLRHPPGLYVLFGTEAAERFSFYTMRAILILYLTRIILPGAFSHDESFRADIEAAFVKDPAVAFQSAYESFDGEPLQQVSAAFLAERGLLQQLADPTLDVDAPLPAAVVASLKAEEPGWRALQDTQYSGEALEAQRESLQNELSKAYDGKHVLEDFADGLRNVVAAPLIQSRFIEAHSAQPGYLAGALDLAFDHQNLRKGEAGSLAAQAIEGAKTDGKGLIDWVLTYKVKHDIRPEALSIYGLYLLLVYLCGLIGGYVADKILGSRKAITMGGIVMGAGLFVMWWPSLVFYGLALIIAGNAFFKPNISTIVSGLYPEGDKRRDPAFTIFYMGINLGAFIAIFGAGYAESMAETHDWGWNIGFVLAGLGMIASLMLFQWGQRYLGTAGFPPGREVTAQSRLGPKDFVDVGLWSVGVAAFALGLVFSWNFVGPVWSAAPGYAKLLLGAVLVLGAIFGMRSRGKKEGGAANEPLTTEEWQRVAVIMILSIFVIFFWAGFEQAGGTMNLFAYEQTDRHIFGWEMPATWFQGFNPLFIFILAPVFSMVWDWNDSKKWGLTTPAKMGLGMIVLGLGFVVMFFGQAQADTLGKASLVWLVAVYFIHTIGELCLSPIGLSMVTKLSPVRIVSLMMGVWFACTAIADYLSGRMEEIVHHLGFSLWVVLFTIPIGAGVVLLALTPVLRKWMHGKG
ncbi:MAG: peptide MFS transporter [Pseudomonadota bacterium]